VAILDSSWTNLTAVVDAEGHKVAPADYTFLRPGRYTVKYQLMAMDREATIDLRARQRYRVQSRSVLCETPIRSPSFNTPGDQEPACRGLEANLGYVAVGTVWIDDAATGRVLAGDKWCTVDTDCPSSRCSIRSPEQSVCDLPQP
jgi:hypothetical protein